MKNVVDIVAGWSGAEGRGRCEIVHCGGKGCTGAVAGGVENRVEDS